MPALALWIAWRLVRALSRRRQARGGARPAHAGAVLQFPRAQVQRQYGADPGVGGDHAVVPALVRDPPPARRGARRGWARRRPCTANTGRCSCCSGSASPRSPTAGARPISARAAPWVTIAVGALALAPHAAWLIANDFVPFSYAVAIHATGSFAAAIGDALGYLGGSLAYVAIPLVICRGRRAAGPRGRQGHGVAGGARAPARRRRVLGGAAGAGGDRAARRRPIGVALVDVGLDAAAGDAVVLAARRHQPPRHHAASSRWRSVFPFVMIAIAPAIALRHSSRRAACRSPLIPRWWWNQSNDYGAKPPTGR